MIDVHTEHCCKDHGCKYRDADCTVVTGAATQADYACEECYNQKLEGLEFGNNSDEPIELVRGSFCDSCYSALGRAPRTSIFDWAKQNPSLIHNHPWAENMLFDVWRL